MRDYDFPFVMSQFKASFTRSKISYNYKDQVKLLFRQLWNSDYYSGPPVGFSNHNNFISGVKY